MCRHFVDSPFIQQQLADGEGGAAFIDGRLDPQPGSQMETFFGFKTDFSPPNPADLPQNDSDSPLLGFSGEIRNFVTFLSVGL